MGTQISGLRSRFPLISKRTGISVDRLGEIAGGSDPTVEELLGISKYLHVPIDALTDFSVSPPAEGLRLRSNKEREALEISELRINTISRFLSSNLPDSMRNRNHLAKASLDNLRSVEGAALDVRRMMHLELEYEPIADISSAIESANLAYVVALKNLGFDGASISLNGFSFLFVSRQYTPRMRFTLAHELGHVIFGHCSNGAVVDTNVRRPGSANSEKLVDAFASCLLVPTQGLTRLLTAVKNAFKIAPDSISSIEIAYVSRFFGLSFEAAGHRLEQLGIVDRGTTRSLQSEIRTRFESPESYMKGLPMQRNYAEIPVLSERLRKELSKLIWNGDLSASRIANTFGYTVGDLYDIVR